MGETHQGGPGTSGRRPARPAPTPSAPGSAVLTPPTGLPAVGAPAVPDQRRSPETRAPEPTRAAPPAAPPAGVRLCACGHAEDAHEHYRPGDDCGACGPAACASFRIADDAGPVRRFLRGLRG